MFKKIYKFRLYILLFLLVFVLASGYFCVDKSILPQTVENKVGSPFLKPELSPETAETTKDTPDTASESPLPSSFLIANMSFQTQAPFANWDALHEEACEEASIILDAYYLNNQPLSEEAMDQEIHRLIQWENDNWDGVKDITAQQAGQLAKTIYGFNYQVIKDTNISELKKQISLGHPVIVPAAGQLLGNPNFRGAGPPYHMVVAIGYDANNIIVQDVGTRNGNHYEYNEKIFYNAWHDWAGTPGNITSGAKTMLILTTN